MVRTLQLSRALIDQQHADVVLEQGIQSALTLLGTEDLR
jgi:TetR/AcrR family transcriptional repressor of nem operon